ncbi:unnamed protein product, partial [Mesorhabditis belari]|uniref:ZP domain-containing protein n=1 Tax=Mesorhabditis belari TaxID=2138241 RepID=A0AAF3EI99_9BILA
MVLRFILFVPFLITVVKSIPIDNGVEGEPEIECGPTSINVNFNTRNPFEGHIYVKGLFADPNCRREETGGRSIAGIELPFDTCNVQRTRSLNPRGIFVSTTVVISFHPQFITKVDRMYKLECFYMEADKTVSTDLHVSDLTTAGIETTIVPMPICRYELHEGGPEGPLIKYGFVGQQIYHRWVCDTETQDTYCMIVNTCTVDDGQGEKIQILDDKGCALDKFVLNNLEYPTDLSAGQEAHIYKFADRPDLFYQCQIAITIKEPNAECLRPECPEPAGFNTVRLTGEIPPGNPNPSAGAEAEAENAGNTEVEAPSARGRGGRRFRRGTAEFDRSNTLDVRTEMSALNIMDEDEARRLQENIGKRSADTQMLPSGHQIVYRTISDGFCLSPFLLSFLAFACFILFGAVYAIRFSKMKSFKE